MSGRRAHETLFLAGVALMPIMRLGADLTGHAVIFADLVFVAAGAAFVVAALTGRARLKRSAFHLPLGAYVAACCIATALSTDLGVSARSLAIDVYVVALAALTFNVLSEPLLRPFANAWLLGTAVTSVTGSAGELLFALGVRDPEVNITLMHYGSLPVGPYARVTGLFLNSNMCASYLGVSLLVMLAMRSLGWLGGRAFGALSALLAVTAAFTVSPALGGLLLGLGLWTWAARRARFALIAGIGAAIAFAWITAVSLNELTASGPLAVIFHPQPSVRWLCWGAALKTFRAHPLTGLGPGVWMECPLWIAPDGGVAELGEAHDTYLNVLALKGILGLAAYVAILVFLLRRFETRLTPEPRAVFLVALGVAFVEAVVYGGLANSFEHTRHLWVLTGAFAALRELRAPAAAG